ncbi:MAG: PKD domain-containing protein [Solirubrobacteraceae bacterium]|nr:PKD domain-containing protein [Solirubrobacteraceae bacterium]
MRRRRCAWVLACTALLAGIAAAPAHAISSVYALQATVATAGGSLVQYTVGAGGALVASAPDIALAATPQDITVTPDGRFAYVATTASIIPFARVAANGRLEPSPGAVGGGATTIIVNPQGTRVHHGQGANVVTRAINADGTLGAPATTPLPAGTFAASVQSLAMTADGRSLYAADAGGATPLVWQFDVDPATGAIAFKNPPAVAWPGVPGPSAPPIGAGRMAITPSSSHLYLATESQAGGIGRWAIGPATGALTAGSVQAPASDTYAEAAVATSVAGDALWAPSGGGTSAAPERIRQFAIGAGGALAPLAPPAVNYVVAGPARDLVAGPDGRTLYLGQDGTVGEWNIGPGGVLAHRANVPPGPVGGRQNAGLALSPSQAPVATFAVAPAPAGQATAFDGSASSDADGAIARYDWDFGDGAVALNAGPTPTHVYASPGVRTALLAVTDADGTSTATLWTGTRALRNGGPSALAARSFTVAAAAAPGPPPRPHVGRSVTVAAERGRILVRVPGSRRYVPIESLTEIPLGSIIDARKGRARITTEVDARTGRTQSSLFYDWFFRILQTSGRKPITEARLVKGSFRGCAPRRARSASVPAFSPSSIAAVAAAAGELRAQSAAKRKRSKRKVRQLWGRGNGSFRTGGKRSSATVRGTWWLVQDRCDATITRVKVGRVDVRDFRLRKTIRLRAKTRRTTYFAKAP